VVARDLSQAFPSLDLLAKADQNQLQMVAGIGPNIAEAIVDWFGRARNLKVLEKLKTAGVWPSNVPSSAVHGRLSVSPSSSPAACPPSAGRA